jgi:competence protein ComGC
MPRKAFTLIEVIIVFVTIVIVFVIVRPRFVEVRTRHGIRLEREELRKLAAALESYCIDCSNYPYELGLLTQVPDLVLKGNTLIKREPFLAEIPHSVFGKHLFPRYFSSDYHWFVWMPGPDRDFDIVVTDDFREAFDILRMNKNWQRKTTASSWLSERLYDPTNGIRSSGDILRTQLGDF